jgi:hypothetical protein
MLCPEAVLHSTTAKRSMNDGQIEIKRRMEETDEQHF